MQGEGGQQEEQDPEGCKVLWSVGSDFLCWERNTGDGASAGHIRAREGETGRLCLKAGVI